MLAAEGSVVEGTLIPSPRSRGKIDDAERRWACKIHKQLIKDVLAEHPVDMIHMHSLDFHQYLPDCDIPVLATLHLPPDWYPAGIFHPERKNLFLNCVSFSQQRRARRVAFFCPRFPTESMLTGYGGPYPAFICSRARPHLPGKRVPLCVGRS